MTTRAMVWLTWRQHRWVLVATAVLALVSSWLLIELDIAETPGASMPLAGFYALLVQTVFGAVIGMFWGAPLVAREFEDGTHVVAWGQDVGPERWLAGKVGVLAAAAILLAVPMGFGDGFRGPQDDLRWGLFEANPLVQTGYALFGLAVGVVAGLLARHALSAMAITLAVYVAVRMVLALGGRDHYLPTLRATGQVGGTAVEPKGAQVVETGYLDANGAVIDFPEPCVGMMNPYRCISENGAARSFVDYQPVERVPAFQFFEFVVCTALAAALFAVAYVRLRRGWRPTRAHRKLVAA